MTAKSQIRLVALIGQLGLGGSERQLFLLLKHLNREIFEPHVVVFNPSAYHTLDDELRQMGIAVYPIPEDCHGILQRATWLYKLFCRLHPQVIHSWTLHDNPYAGVIGRLAGVKVCLGSVRGSLATSRFTGLSPLFQWLVLHSGHALLTNSLALSQELTQKGIPERLIKYLPNCVEIPPAHNTIRHPSLAYLPQNGRTIGMVANLRQEKNHILFVEAMGRLLPAYPDLFGVILGQPIPSDPSIPVLIQERIRDLNMETRFVLAGFHPDIPRVLPYFYAFCLASHSEGTPNAVLEAMAAGLPVVATRVGGLPSLIEDGISGFLVDPGDVEGLTQALSWLLDHPDQACAMGAAARQRALAEFSCQMIVPQLEAYYQGFLS